MLDGLPHPLAGLAPKSLTVLAALQCWDWKGQARGLRIFELNKLLPICTRDQGISTPRMMNCKQSAPLGCNAVTNWAPPWSDASPCKISKNKYIHQWNTINLTHALGRRTSKAASSCSRVSCNTPSAVPAFRVWQRVSDCSRSIETNIVIPCSCDKAPGRLPAGNTMCASTQNCMLSGFARQADSVRYVNKKS